jgi:hypothetical protein
MKNVIENKNLMSKEKFLKMMNVVKGSEAVDTIEKDYEAYIEREKMDISFDGIKAWRNENSERELGSMTIGEAKVVASQLSQLSRMDITYHNIFKQIETMTTPRNISDKFYDGKSFTSHPGDVMTIKSTSNMISNSIAIHITNDGMTSQASIITDEYLTLTNRIEAWELLKRCNEIESREVMYQIDDNTPIKYEDSIPYEYRFGG